MWNGENKSASPNGRDGRQDDRRPQNGRDRGQDDRRAPREQQQPPFPMTPPIHSASRHLENFPPPIQAALRNQWNYAGNLPNPPSWMFVNTNSHTPQGPGVPPVYRPQDFTAQRQTVPGGQQYLHGQVPMEVPLFHHQQPQFPRGHMNVRPTGLAPYPLMAQQPHARTPLGSSQHSATMGHYTVHHPMPEEHATVCQPHHHVNVRPTGLPPNQLVAQQPPAGTPHRFSVHIPPMMGSHSVRHPISGEEHATVCQNCGLLFHAAPPAYALSSARSNTSSNVSAPGNMRPHNEVVQQAPENGVPRYHRVVLQRSSYTRPEHASMFLEQEMLRNIWERRLAEIPSSSQHPPQLPGFLEDASPHERTCPRHPYNGAHVPVRSVGCQQRGPNVALYSDGRIAPISAPANNHQEAPDRDFVKSFEAAVKILNKEIAEEKKRMKEAKAAAERAGTLDVMEPVEDRMADMTLADDNAMGDDDQGTDTVDEAVLLTPSAVKGHMNARRKLVFMETTETPMDQSSDDVPSSSAPTGDSPTPSDSKNGKKSAKKDRVDKIKKNPGSGQQ